MSVSKSVVPALLVITAALVVGPVVLNLIRGPAETPGVFDQHYTLTQASELSQETGKPMLVLATADWCAPCQKLKRTTMVDPEVVEWVSEHTVPVFLEDGENGQEIGSLGVRAYPTTMLIADGKIITSFQGVVGSQRLLGELRARVAEMSE